MPVFHADFEAVYTGSDPSTILIDGFFDADIEWALTHGWYGIDPVSGEITVAGAPQYQQEIHEANGTVLRSAEGAYIQTDGGTLTIKAQGQIGSAVRRVQCQPQGDGGGCADSDRGQRHSPGCEFDHHRRYG